MNYISDLHITQEIIYKKLGSRVELVCPIVNTTRSITWLGPSNYQHYAVGTDVFPAVATQVTINETSPDKESVLLIHRLTRNRSGNYRCSDFVNNRDFNLIIKSKIIFNEIPFSNYIT